MLLGACAPVLVEAVDELWLLVDEELLLEELEDCDCDCDELDDDELLGGGGVLLLGVGSDGV